MIVGKAYSGIGVLFQQDTFQSYKESVLDLCETWSGTRFKYLGTLSNKTNRCLRESSETFDEAYPLSLSNLSYPERLVALDLEPLEFRILQSDCSSILQVFTQSSRASS